MASMLNHIEQRVIAAAGVKVSLVGPIFDCKNYGGEMEMVESRWQRLVPLHICSPHYRLSDSEDVVASLGSSITQINVFDDQLKRWIPADLAHTFKLEPRSHVFIRRFGVTHFDDQYALAKESSWPRSLMFNMKGERQRIRQKIKCKDESDDDIEVIDGSLITPRRGPSKRPHKSSPRHDVHEGRTPTRQGLRSPSPTSTISSTISRSASIASTSSPLSSATSGGRAGGGST